MKKAELIKSISEKSGLSKADASRALEAFTATIVEGVAFGDQITVPGLGTFVQKERGERQGRNPKTGETITIAASKLPHFTPSSSFRTAVKG